VCREALTTHEEHFSPAGARLRRWRRALSGRRGETRGVFVVIVGSCRQKMRNIEESTSTACQARARDRVPQGLRSKRLRARQARQRSIRYQRALAYRVEQRMSRMKEPKAGHGHAHSFT